MRLRRFAPVDRLEEHREKTGSAQYDPEIQRRLPALFPKGMERVALTDLRGRPEYGVSFDGDSDLLRAAGLRKNNIVVALNGVRVYDQSQYVYLRGRTSDPALSLIVWNGREYVERTASPPQGRFGVPISSYNRAARR